MLAEGAGEGLPTAQGPGEGLPMHSGGDLHRGDDVCSRCLRTSLATLTMEPNQRPLLCACSVASDVGEGERTKWRWTTGGEGVLTAAVEEEEAAAAAGPAWAWASLGGPDGATVPETASGAAERVTEEAADAGRDGEPGVSVWWLSKVWEPLLASAFRPLGPGLLL